MATPGCKVPFFFFFLLVPLAGTAGGSASDIGSGVLLVGGGAGYGEGDWSEGSPRDRALAMSEGFEVIPKDPLGISIVHGHLAYLWKRGVPGWVSTQLW